MSFDLFQFSRVALKLGSRTTATRTALGHSFRKPRSEARSLTGNECEWENGIFVCFFFLFTNSSSVLKQRPSFCPDNFSYFRRSFVPSSSTFYISFDVFIIVRFWLRLVFSAFLFFVLNQFLYFFIRFRVSLFLFFFPLRTEHLPPMSFSSAADVFPPIFFLDFRDDISFMECDFESAKILSVIFSCSL